MPDRDVKTIRDLLYYQYAKIISKRAFSMDNGIRAKREHIVPRSIQIKPECPSCDKIQSIHNQVWACKHCNSLKGPMGLYEFFKSMYPNEKKFYDFIPPLLEKKYLKTIYYCHECTQTLEKVRLKADRELSVLAIDFILHLEE